MTLTGITFGGAAAATPVAVPSVVGQLQADAENTLKGRGFKVSATAIESDGTEGTVFSQDPQGNTAANRGSTVRLFIIDNPVVPVDIGQQLTEIKTALALVETDATAAQRNQAVLDKLDTVETDTTAAERNQAVLDKLDTVETDYSAEQRNQGVLDKLNAVETDDSAESRKQEVLDALAEHDKDHTARKSSSTQRRS